MLCAVRRLLLLLVFSSALAFAGDAPATSPASQEPELPSAPSQIRAAEREQSRPGKFKELLLGATRPHGVVEGGSAPPMSPASKFHLFSRTTIDPYHLFVVSLVAGAGQATDTFHEYGQGMSGYGKRYGAALADDVSSRFFGTFVYPSLLKEDPRYYRLGKGAVPKRVFYAMAQEFVTHRDSGGRRFNFSNPLGAVTAGAISNAYYPPADRGFELTMQRAGISLAIGSGHKVLKEFWPDIRRKLLRSKTQSPR